MPGNKKPKKSKKKGASRKKKSTSASTVQTNTNPLYQLQEDQVTRAVHALSAVLEYKSRQDEKSGGAKSLFEVDEDIFLQFALHTTPAAAKNKPYQIPLVHTLFGQEGQEICVITTDPGSDVKAHLQEHPVEGVTKVLPFMNLKRNYNTYKLKRDILNSYDLFLADERIIPLLPPVLGKAFFTRKKQPVPVLMKGQNFHTQIAKARDSTYFFPTHGPSCSVRIARASFDAGQIVANVMGAIEHIVKRIPQGWRNIQGIFLKSTKSAALPVYSALPEQTHTLIDPSASDSKRKRKGPVPPPGDDAGIDEIMDFLSAPKQKKRKTADSADASEDAKEAAAAPAPTTTTASKAAARKAALLAGKTTSKSSKKKGKKSEGKKSTGKKSKGKKSTGTKKQRRS